MRRRIYMQDVPAPSPNLTALVNGKGKIIFSVSGYADTRPIADNSTDAGRRDNHRILHEVARIFNGAKFQVELR